MMPPSAVFDMAPANVLQGAVRLQLLTSSPTPDTQLRVACASAVSTRKRLAIRAIPRMAGHAIFVMIALPAHLFGE